MAGKKFKFEMSITGFTIKFEGEQEQGQKVQQGFTTAINQLANMQNGMLGLEEHAHAPVIDTPTVVQRSTRRRNRKKSSRTLNGDSLGTAELPLEGDEEKETERRSPVAPVTNLVIGLRTEGFFNQPRTVGEMLNELIRRGHTGLTTSSFSGALQRLCRNQVLSRVKDSTLNVWVYSPGPKNE